MDEVAFHRPLPIIRWLLVALLAIQTLAVAVAHGAEPESAADWEQMAIADPVSKLALSGGAIYVLTHDESGEIDALWRTDDAGTVWRSPALPAPRISDLAADPRDPRRLYLAGTGGIYRSVDGGATWSLVVSAPPRHSGLRVVVSPVDPALLYAATGLDSTAATWRSVDGGANWEQVKALRGDLCIWIFPLITPDPVVRERVYWSYYCSAGRTFSASLRVSDDLGATDGETLLPAGISGPLSWLFPQAASFSPNGRLGITLVSRHPQIGGSELLRTEDRGQSWQTIVEYPRAWSGAAAGYVPNVGLRGPLVQPLGSGPLFVGLNGEGRGVLGSEDQGASWWPVGTRSIGAVRALEFDSATAVLYAGTERGLWRIVTPRPRIARAGAPRYAPTPALVRTVLGGGSSETFDGAPPLDLKLRNLYAATVERDASLLAVADGMLIRLRPDGTVQTVAISPRAPSPGIPAAAPDGRILYTRRYSPFSTSAAVHALTPSGVVELIAGRGDSERGTSDPTTAVGAPLLRATGLAVDTSGAIYVADSGNHVVRRIDPNGTIQTVAGTGRAGWNGDGAAATDSDLDEPWALALDQTGRLLIADRAGQRIVRLEADGTLVTVAGSGVMGYAGDGGPAASASLAFPSSITVDNAGRIFVADTLNHAIRLVDTDGTIWTLAGTGRAGDAADEPASAAAFNLPLGVAWDGANGLYVADSGNNRVRWIGPL